MSVDIDPGMVAEDGHYAAGGGPGPAPDETPVPDPMGFTQWARMWLEATAPTTEKKAAEYGSNSLAKKGYRFAAAQHTTGLSMSDALQLGIAQYALEKMDRVEDALLRGQSASDDTWVDIAVYALMMGYVRTYGRWP